MALSIVLEKSRGIAEENDKDGAVTVSIISLVPENKTLPKNQRL